MQSLYDYPDIYDAMHAAVVEDVEVYGDLARHTGGPVLEVGCGTGRISSALVGAGFTVYGLDSSVVLLARAQEKIERLQTDNGAAVGRFIPLQADILEYSDPLSVPLVILPLNFCAHLHTMCALVGMFAAVRRLLAPGGQVVLHAFPEGSGVAERDGLVHRASLSLRDAGKCDWYESRTVSGGLERLIWYVQTSDSDYTFSLVLRIWNRRDLVRAAATAGFRLVEPDTPFAGDALFLRFAAASEAAATENQP